MTPSAAYFNHNGHLNSTGLQLYTRAVLGDELERLPEEVYEHGSTCLECSERILEELEE